MRVDVEARLELDGGSLLGESFKLFMADPSKSILG